MMKKKQRKSRRRHRRPVRARSPGRPGRFRRISVVTALGLLTILVTVRIVGWEQALVESVVDAVESALGSALWFLPPLLILLALIHGWGFHYTRRRRLHYKLIIGWCLVPVGLAYLSMLAKFRELSGGWLGEVYVSYWIHALGAAIGVTAGLALWLFAVAALIGEKASLRFARAVASCASRILVSSYSAILGLLKSLRARLREKPPNQPAMSTLQQQHEPQPRVLSKTDRPAAPTGNPSDWIHLPPPESAPVVRTEAQSHAGAPQTPSEHQGEPVEGVFSWPDEPLPLSILDPSLESDASDQEEISMREVPDIHAMTESLIAFVQKTTGIRLESVENQSGIGPGHLFLTFRKIGGSASVSKLARLDKDVGLLFERSPVRLVIGETIRWEIPLLPEERTVIRFADLMRLYRDREIDESSVYLAGVKDEGEPLTLKFKHACHILVAGATGSGKTVGLHSLLFSLIFRFPPSQVRIALGDHKVYEFEPYRRLPHRWGTFAVDSDSFHSLARELEEELRHRKEARRLNRDAHFPTLICFIDEFQGFDTGRLVKLLAEARALEMYFILATQHPLAEILSSPIKANLVTRMAFRTRDTSASHLILGSPDAASLRGGGDAIVSHSGGVDRVQMPWVTSPGDEELSDLERLQRFLENPEPMIPESVASNGEHYAC